MIKNIFSNIIEITLSTSIVIALLLIFSNRLDNKYNVKWRYWIWLIISIRLILPFTINIPDAPIRVSPPEIIQSIDNNDIQKTNEEVANVIIQNQNIEDSRTKKSYNHSTSIKDKFNIEEIIIILWIGGIIVFLAYHLIVYFLYRKNIKPWCYDLEDTEILSVYEKICKEIKVRKNIPIMKCKEIKSPMVMGLWNMVLLLPDKKFSGQHLEMILRHELIHIKRNDILYKSIILLARAVHWFNPLVHFMAIRANKDVELSCDAAVVESQSMDYRKIYSEAILAAVYKGEVSKAVFSTYFGGGKEMFIKRFNNLFDSRKKKKGFTIMVAVILLLATLGVCVSCTQDTSSKTNDMIIYENENLGFSIGFPKGWEDRYILEEIDNGITVISKRNSEFGGLLFSIERLVGELITEEDMEQAPSSEVIILQGNGYTYIVRYPSDMQYPPDDVELSEEYELMSEQVPDICKSIDILGGKYPEASNDGFKVIGSSFFTAEIPRKWEIHASTEWPLLWELYVAGDEIKESEGGSDNQKDNTIAVKMNKIGEIEMVPYKSEGPDDDQMTTVYITSEEIFSKARISLDIDNPNREIIDKIKNSFVFTGSPYTVVDLQTDAQRYLDGGGKKIFGQIEDFEMEDGIPIAVQIKVMELIPDDSNDNNSNGFHIKDLNKTERYSMENGVSIAPLIAPNYNTYGIYKIHPLDEIFIESYEHLKDFYYDFIIGSDGELKIILGHYIP